MKGMVLRTFFFILFEVSATDATNQKCDGRGPGSDKRGDALRSFFR